MIGWINKNSGESATHFLGRLKNDFHDYVKTDCASGSTIAYSANGLILRQKEDEVVFECRGLHQDAAALLLDLQSDQTQTTTYYKAVGDNGEYAVVGIVTGTKTTVVGHRVNEAGAWNVTITTLTFSATDASGWTTSRPSAATAVGIITDHQKTATRIDVLWKSPGSDACAALYQNEETETREFQFLTHEEAVAKVNQYISDRTGQAKVIQIDYDTTHRGFAIKDYTSYKVSARYVSPERGWTVVLISTTYSPAAYYGAATGVTFNPKWYYKDKDKFGRDVIVNITAEPFKRVYLLTWTFGTTSHAELVED